MRISLYLVLIAMPFALSEVLGLNPFQRMWLTAFFFTQAIEIPVYAIALRPRPWHHRLALAFGASLLTHPVIWFALPWYHPSISHQVLFVVAELFAWGTEGLYLRQLKVRDPWLWSLAANGLSAGLGELLRHFWGWP